MRRRYKDSFASEKLGYSDRFEDDFDNRAPDPFEDDFDTKQPKPFVENETFDDSLEIVRIIGGM